MKTTGKLIKRIVSGLLLTTLTAGLFSSCGIHRLTEEEKSPLLINTKYETDDIVTADIIIDEKSYQVDPSGVKDSTEGIKKALYDCDLNGGGTLWLPVGKYRITSPIEIPAFVTLRGDWQDPDVGKEYGTVLLIDIMPTTKEDMTGTIYLKGSGGVKGLTVFYPNQTLDDVKPYPFTFYVKGQGDGYMLQNIVNCTLINSYKGLGVCVAEENAHEMLTVENLKGTVLYEGAEVYNQADVGTWRKIKLDTSYWATAGKDYNAPDEARLKEYTKKNTVGFRFGDLEWTQFDDIAFSDMLYGIHLIKGKRIEFAAAFYNLNIKGCQTALRADNMDHRWGSVIAQSYLEGENAVINNSEGVFRFSGVETVGALQGSIIKDDVPRRELIREKRVPLKPRKALLLTSADKTGKTDVSEVLQSELNKMAAQGGGLVYLPSGLYRLEKPILVPEGVEVRGSVSVAQREQLGNSKGTLLLAYYGKTESDEAAKTAEALITLDGKGAGLRNLRILYPEAIALCDKDGSYFPYAFTVRGRETDVYTVNCAISGGYNGVDFSGCDRHIIKKLIGFCFNNMMTLGGKDGEVSDCLHNGTAISRTGTTEFFKPLNETENLFNNVFHGITRHKTEVIRITADADGEFIKNVFAYGIKSLFVTEGKLVYAVNLGTDNLGPQEPQFEMNGGEFNALNILRYNGRSYRLNKGRLRLFNRQNVDDKREQKNFEAYRP